MARIAQAYFHFHTRLSEKALRKFGRQIDRVARRAAIKNFDGSVLIEVEIEEGSLIGRVTAVATILALYTGLISNYKGVKDSVREMCEDARSFGADVCTKAIKLAQINEKQVYRIERRTKTVGKLGRLLSDVERLENSVDDLSPAQLKKELRRLNHGLQMISKDIGSKEREALGNILNHTKLPPPSKWPRGDIDEPKALLKPEQLELTYQEAPRLEDESKRIFQPIRYRNSFKVEPKKRMRRETLLLPKP
jgi:hypothetical protein